MGRSEELFERAVKVIPGRRQQPGAGLWLGGDDAPVYRGRFGPVYF